MSSLIIQYWSLTTRNFNFHTDLTEHRGEVKPFDIYLFHWEYFCVGDHTHQPVVWQQITSNLSDFNRLLMSGHCDNHIDLKKKNNNSSVHSNIHRYYKLKSITIIYLSLLYTRRFLFFFFFFFTDQEIPIPSLRTNTHEPFCVSYTCIS